MTEHTPRSAPLSVRLDPQEMHRLREAAESIGTTRNHLAVEALLYAARLVESGRPPPWGAEAQGG